MTTNEVSKRPYTLGTCRDFRALGSPRGGLGSLYYAGPSKRDPRKFLEKATVNLRGLRRLAWSRGLVELRPGFVGVGNLSQNSKNMNLMTTIDFKPQHQTH